MSNACGDPVAPDGPVQFDGRRDREQMFERHEPAKGDVVFARLRAETERRHREAVDAFARRRFLFSQGGGAARISLALALLPAGDAVPTGWDGCRKAIDV